MAQLDERFSVNRSAASPLPHRGSVMGSSIGEFVNDGGDRLSPPLLKCSRMSL